MQTESKIEIKMKCQKLWCNFSKQKDENAKILKKTYGKKYLNVIDSVRFLILIKENAVGHVSHDKHVEVFERREA